MVELVALGVAGVVLVVGVWAARGERKRYALELAANNRSLLDEHHLAVVDDNGVCFVDRKPGNSRLIARAVAEGVEVRAAVAAIVHGVESLWVRRVSLSPDGFDPGFLEVDGDVRAGGLPAPAVTALLSSPTLRADLARIVREGGGRVAVDNGELVALVVRDDRFIEPDVRRAFDLVGPVLAAMTVPATETPLRETSVTSSSGSPMVIRGIDT